jgi:glyoxylase-like metal-dependent hydrolase (beta-lactamase superfamily II)
MPRLVLGRVLVAVLGALSLLSASAALPVLAQPSRSLSELVQVKPDVYAFRYLAHVSMFIVGSDSVLVVDPIGQANPRAPSVLKQAIGSVTDRPVKYMVYSHWGADHGMGGAVFSDTATFVSHQNAAPKIAQANDPASPPPDVTFADSLTLDLGGRSVELHGTSLTPESDYLFVYDGASKTLMLVDLARTRALPFQDLPGTPPDRMLALLGSIDQQFDFDTFLWGHGAGPTLFGSRDDFRDHRQYYSDLVAAIREARAGGQADNSEGMLASVRDALSAKYSSWANFPTGLAANISGAIRWGV